MPLIDWKDVEWGTVPAWVAAGSLLLAFRIFLRDRSAGERSQVEQVAAWASVEGEPQAVPGYPDLMKASLRLKVKNASDLPVHIVDFTWESRLHTRDDDAHVGAFFGHNPNEQLHTGYRVLGPEETWTVKGEFFALWWKPAPPNEDRIPLTFDLLITKVLLVDAAGRKWIVLPTKGSPKKVLWFNFFKRRAFTKAMEGPNKMLPKQFQGADDFIRTFARDRLRDAGASPAK